MKSIVLALALLLSEQALAQRSESVEIYRVTTAEELLLAIGSDRTVVLAPGLYNLSGVTPRALPHVRWEAVFDGQQVVIEGVERLTLRGAPGHASRVVIEPRYADVLHFRAVRDVVVEDLWAGHSEADGECAGAVVEVTESTGITVRRSVLHGSGTEGVTLDGVRQARFEGVEITHCTTQVMTLWRSEGVLFDDCVFRETEDMFHPLIELEDSWDVRIRGGELHAKTFGDQGLEHFFGVRERSALRLEGLVLVDQVSGQRRPLDAVLPPEAAGSLPSGDPAAVAFDLRRRQDGEVWNVELHLGDGRHFALGFEPVERLPAYGGLLPDSVTVRRLGGGEGPIYIHWVEEGGGMGGYASAHYRVVGPGPEDPVLLGGSVLLSGHSGWDEHWGGDYSLRREGDQLMLRREALHWTATEEPGPLRRREAFSGEDHYVMEIETAVEILYRYRSTGVTAQRFAMFYKVHEDDTLAAVVKELELQPGWARNAQPWPAVGEWLRFDLPLPVGQRRYPAVRAGE